MMNHSFEDPIVLLDKIFRTRQLKEEGYSLRMFANDLGVSVSILSDMFNGKRGMSKRRAESLAKRLGLVDEERTYFCAAASFFHGRSFQTRQEAKNTLISLVTKGRSSIEQDTASLHIDWQGKSILELLRISPQLSTYEIARRLKISKRECQEVLGTLAQAELISEDDGVFSVVSRYNSSPDAGMTEALLSRARQALYGQEGESHMSSLIFSFNSNDLMAAKQRLIDFMNEFNKEFGAANPDEVYCLGLEFFRLSDKTSTETLNSQQNAPSINNHVN